MSIDSIIYLIGAAVTAVTALTVAGMATHGKDTEVQSEDVLAFLVVVIFWPLVVGGAVLFALGYLPFHGGRMLEERRQRRLARAAEARRDQMTALRAARDVYPEHTLTWQILNDQLPEEYK